MWLSKNQHGVHSPFVYDLITKSIYTQSKTNNSKKKRIIEGIFQHVTIKSYKKVGNPFMSFDSSKIQYSTDGLQLIHIENPTLIRSLKKETNQLIVIEKIHHNRHFENNWKVFLKSQPKIISLDFFVIGIVFVKDTQAKEHFILRA